jgi:site-specific DNA-methyltransferase (adenine-specific)
VSADVLRLDTPLPIEDVQPVVRPAGRLAPERVYDSPLVTLYQGHAEDVLPLMSTESVDLIVTDPPYGVDWQSNRRAEQFDKIAYDGAGDRDTIRAVLAECVRLVRQHRHLYVFGPGDVLDGLKVSDVAELIWDKQTLGSGDVTSVWGPSHERINFTVSKHRHAGKAGKPVLPTRMRRGTVLGYTRPTGKAVRHPSEKPVPLLRELIESSSKQHELVLDPYAGVGSTGVAAVLAGRRAVLCEVNPRYCDIAIERIQKAEALVSAMNGI